MLENDLDEFIVVQKKDHLFYCLRKDIRKRLQMMINMSITRNRLATLTQRIKNSQISKIDSKNKFQSDRDSSSELHLKSTKQRSRRDETMLDRADQANNSIDEDRNDEIARLFLKRTDEQSSDFKDERICYNYGEKKHITSKCLKLKQENPQINAIENSRQNTQTVVGRAPSVRLITEVFDESEN